MVGKIKSMLKNHPPNGTKDDNIIMKYINKTVVFLLVEKHHLLIKIQIIKKYATMPPALWLNQAIYS